MPSLLVIDDEPLILAGLLSIIRKANIPFEDVRTANDGIAALEVLQSFRPDLIVTDIQMPELTGLELIQRVRDIHPEQKFMILTGYDHFEYVRQALRYRVIDYHLKPIDKKEFIRSLLNAIGDLDNEKSTQAVAFDKYEKAHRDTTDSPILQVKGNYSDHMQRIVGFIHRHYMQDLSLEQVSEHVHLTPSYISAIFKKEAGLNFIPYLHMFRVAQAQKLMDRQPKLPLDKVARQVGYQNPRYFFKMFKKYSGLTPGKYRDTEPDDRENQD